MIACFDMDFDMGGAHGGGSRGGKQQAKEAGGGSAKPTPAKPSTPAKPLVPASGPTTASAADAEPPVRVAHASERQRFAAGAPSVVPADAPCPKRHRPRLAEREIVAVFARKTEVRERGIAAILDAARAEGQPIERFMAAIRYDCEQAPKTTNRRQLVEIGVAVPRPDRLPASASELHHALWCVIYGLARLGIFLTGTERLDDRALLAKLCGRILDDEVRDIPPSADMSEFIDVDPRELPAAAGQSSAQAHDPDGLSGPFDFGSGDEDDDPSRARGKPSATATKASATKVPAAAAVVDRDRLLPRPDRA
jgi:hypothetical protein